MEMLTKEIPKAELHLHIEGTLEPEMLIEIARGNNIRPKYRSVKEVKRAYNFRNLQDFLDVYYESEGSAKGAGFL